MTKGAYTDPDSAVTAGVDSGVELCIAASTLLIGDGMSSINTMAATATVQVRMKLMRFFTIFCLQRHFSTAPTIARNLKSTAFLLSTNFFSTLIDQLLKNS